MVSALSLSPGTVPTTRLNFPLGISPAYVRSRWNLFNTRIIARLRARAVPRFVEQHEKFFGVKNFMGRGTRCSTTPALVSTNQQLN